MTTPTQIQPARSVVSPGAHAVTRSGQWTQREAELIANVIARGFSEDELSLFAAICKHTGLDPFRKQIYAWKDKGRLTIHLAIDGLRATAARTGDYEGQEGPQWCGSDGVWLDVWLKDEPPAACRVGVLHRGWANPVWSTVKWTEFERTKRRTGAQGPTVWDEKPAHMLATRAEGHALRRAFPEVFDGFAGQLAAMNATVIAGDADEIPAIEGVALAVLEEGQTEPANAGEEPAETTQEEARSEPESDAQLSPADLEAWNVDLHAACEKARVPFREVFAALGTRNNVEEMHAAMVERGLDIAGVVSLAKGGGA